MAEVGVEISITGGEEFEGMRVQDVGRLTSVTMKSPRIMERVTVKQELFTGQQRDEWVA